MELLFIFLKKPFIREKDCFILFKNVEVAFFFTSLSFLTSFARVTRSRKKRRGGKKFPSIEISFSYNKMGRKVILSSGKNSAHIFPYFSLFHSIFRTASRTTRTSPTRPPSCTANSSELQLEKCGE